MFKHTNLQNILLNIKQVFNNKKNLMHVKYYKEYKRIKHRIEEYKGIKHRIEEYKKV